MKWIKQKADVTTYRCSRCGSIWMTVKIKAKPPKRCKACGAVAEKTPSVTADAVPPPSEREADGREDDAFMTAFRASL